ncbi:MAG TPA: TonB-dependent receptor [Chitinophagaceae bacterium]|nr:TonB-dependent receptor [Chitinophagaceae bacterium]
MKQTKIRDRIAVLLLATASCILLNVQAFAQTGARKITGIITSKVSGKAIGGAAVTVQGTKNGTLTDDNGAFSIYASTGETLQVSFVGYTPREVKVGEGTQVNVVLDEDYSHLQDVVVIGYGKMKKTDLSSSQVTVTSEELNRTVNTTFDQALQGRAANVYVATSNAQPGGAPSVMIRGVNSLSQTNQPLYIIDGVQIQPADPGGGAAGTYNTPGSYSNALAGINPDDIETINVLQGPAATGIYGSAGGNGVILITTKHGKAGETKVSLNSLLTLQDIPKFAPVLNLPQYAIFRNELSKAGGASTEADYGDPSVLGNGTNWQDALFRRTLLQKHSLSLSGGSDKTTFYFSGEYFNQDGIAQGSGFTRGSVRLNLDNNTRKWLRIGTNLSVNLTKERIVTSNNSLIYSAIDISPAIPVKNPDGTWGGPAAGTPYANNYINPIAFAQINTNYNKGFGALGGVYADITFMKGLTLHNEFNGTYNYTSNYIFNPSYTFGATVNANTYASQSTGNNYWWGTNSRLQYDVTIGKHNISAMVAHESQAWGWEGLLGSKTGFVNNTVHTLNAGASDNTQSNSSSQGSGAKESYFARVNYIYDNKYILQGVFRYDGASVFGEANRWGSFPSVSAAWKISEEKFMKGIRNLNELKLRVEYGLSGNSSASSSAQYAVLSTWPSVFGASYLPSNFPNPDIQWEVDKTTNVGFDLHMFNNRLEVIADAYVKNLTKLLASSTYPGYLGGGTGNGGLAWPVTNIGAMQNKGFGITVNTVNISKKNFTWKTGVNFSLDRNKVTALAAPLNITYVTNTNNNQTQFLTEVGQPVGMITGYIAEGLFQNYKDITSHANQTSNSSIVVDPNTGTWVGDIKFKDINGDGVINEKDRVILGNPWPKFTFGFNNSFSYKRFDLNIFVIGSVGGKIVNVLKYENDMPGAKGAFENYYASVINFARPTSYNAADAATVTLENPNTNVPRVYTSTANGNNRLSQWDLESGTYAKIKNVSLSYNVPTKSFANVVKGLRVSVNVQNLLTITKYTGMDPEVGPFNYWNNGNPTIINGIDNGRYPSTRMYSFNILADF